MPLTIGPVKVYQNETPEVEAQAKGRKQAVFMKVPPQAIFALKDAILKARASVPASVAGIPADSSPMQVVLAGDNPGISIAGRFFPITLQPSANQPSDLFTRTRMLHPKKARDHRPDLYYAAPIVANANFQRGLGEDAHQKLREQSAMAERKRKERTIQMYDPGSAPKSVAGKKRKPAGSGTASNLGRAVMEKNAGAMAKNEGWSGGNASASTSAAASAPPPTKKPTSNAAPLDTTSLKARIVHQLALKSATSQDLRSSMKDDEKGLSEILRNIATPEPAAPSNSTKSHWGSAYASPARHTGLWYLKPEVYASSVHPYTWPSYDDADRRRIAEDVLSAIDQLGLPETASERSRLSAEESAWSKRRRIESGDATSGKKLTAPGATRRVKMKKLSEPPAATGNTLSANVRKGAANGVAPTTTTTTTKVKKTDRGSGRDSDVESIAKKKRTSPTTTNAPTSGRATPMSTSSSGSGTSAAPLAHGLPPKPATSLAPPSSQRSSRTPPLPPATTQLSRPSPAGPGRTATPSASPRVSSSSTVTKRRLEEQPSDLDDGASTRRNGKEPSVDVPKKRKSETPALAAAGAALKASTSTAPRKAEASSSKPRPHLENGNGSASSSAGRPSSSQALKPPITLANGRTQSSGSATVTNKHERAASPLPSFKRKQPVSPIGPSSVTQSTAKQRPGTKDLAPPQTTKHRPEPQAARKARRTPDFTSSSEEEEEEEEDPRRSTKTKKKSGKQGGPTPSNRHPSPPRASKPLPSPLPRSRQELRLLYSDKYAEYIGVYAQLASQRSMTEQAKAGRGDASGLWSDRDMKTTVEVYGRLHEELEVVKKAVQDSLDAEGQAD